MRENLLEVITEVSKEKALDRDHLVRLVVEAIVQAAKRKLPYETIEGSFNPKTGQIELFQYKEVVEIVEDGDNEVSIEEVQEIDPEAQIGDEVEYEINEKEFNRIARSARNIIFSSIRDAEREMIVNTFEKRVGEVLTGTVLRTESNGRIALRFLDKTDAYLFRREQIPGETFGYGDHVRVYLMDVNNNPQKPSQLSISRTHPGLLIKLFEMEVPEIYDGIVKVVSAAREPGKRAKISVYATDPDVDPVGSCVGVRGSRVQNIVNELYGEKIDIVRWNENVVTYVTNALAPAEIESMDINEEEREIDVTVRSDQLSLAIGSKGQNVRLASKLVNYKINISSKEDNTPSIEEQLTMELERGREERELLYSGMTAGMPAVAEELATPEPAEVVDTTEEAPHAAEEVATNSPESAPEDEPSETAIPTPETP